MQYKGITLPEGLRKDTLMFVRNILNRLKEDGNLRRHDEFLLYKLANNIDHYLSTEEDLRREGLLMLSDRGNYSLNPAAAYRLKLEGLINADLREMGLTLGARSRIKGVEAEEESSPFATFAIMPDDDD